MKKKTFFNRIMTLFLLLGTLLSCPLPLKAAESSAPSTEAADAVLLYQIEHGKTLVAKNVEKRIYPASTVKIMTGVLAIEKLQGRLDQTVTVTGEMLALTSGKRLGLVAGERVRIKDLLFATVCGGNNDAAYVLAHTASGSAQAFVGEMNEKALSLGMTATHYTNPTGMDDPDMYTTAEDVMRLAQYALSVPLFMEIASTQKYAMAATTHSGARNVHNRNYLVSATVTNEYYYAPAKGLNAGSTTGGGDCVVTSTSVGDLSYVCVVMGVTPPATSSDVTLSYVLAKNLLLYARNSFEYVTLLEKGTVLTDLPVTLSGRDERVDLILSEDVSLLLDTGLDREAELTYSIKLLQESLKAPVAQGQTAGYVSVLHGEELLATAQLVTAAAVERSAFLNALNRIKEFSSSRTFLATLITFVILSALYVYFHTGRRRRRNRTRAKYFRAK